MAATLQGIREWLERAEPEHTHMIVMCDTFDHDDYPVFVESDEDVKPSLECKAGKAKTKRK